jgi:hypothetical protein
MNKYYDSQVLTSNTNTTTKDVYNCDRYAIQADYTGTFSGSLKLQVSNDEADSVTNWVDLTGSDIAITSAGSYIWNVKQVGYRAVRVVYTYVSGSVTLSLSFTAKGE